MHDFKPREKENTKFLGYYIFTTLSLAWVRFQEWVAKLNRLIIIKRTNFKFSPDSLFKLGYKNECISRNEIHLWVFNFFPYLCEFESFPFGVKKTELLSDSFHTIAIVVTKYFACALDWARHSRWLLSLKFSRTVPCALSRIGFWFLFEGKTTPLLWWFCVRTIVMNYFEYFSSGRRALVNERWSVF